MSLESPFYAGECVKTAHFALHHQPLIRAIAQTHEIASHGFYHSSFELADLAFSKQTLEHITQAPITGFRMTRLQQVNDHAIESAGYTYNSFMNPTYLPGRYNNFLLRALPTTRSSFCIFPCLSRR